MVRSVLNVNGELSSDRPFGSAAHKYLEAGWAGVFPLPARQKYPPPAGVTGWRGRDMQPPQTEDVQRKHPSYNIGLRMPIGVVGIDVDAYDQKHGDRTLWDLEKDLGKLPETPVLSSRDDGRSGIRFYRIPGDKVLAGVMGEGIDVLQRHHRFAVAAPSIHPKTGDPYVWRDAAGNELDGVPVVEALPALPKAWVRRFEVRPREAGAADPATSRLVSLWLQSHDGEGACPAVLGKVEDFLAQTAKGAARHDSMLTAQLGIVSLGAAGHQGATEGLEQLHDVFREALGPDRDGDAEFFEALAGAVGIVHQDPPRVGNCCPTPTGRPELCDPDVPAEGPDYYLGLLSDQQGVLAGTFRYGEQFVWCPRIGQEGYVQPPEDSGDSDGPAQIHPLDGQGLSSYINRSVWLYKESVGADGRRRRVRTYGSQQTWATVVRRARTHWPLPLLRGVTHTPTVRPDGTVLDQPGYDPGSGLAYMPLAGLKVPAIPVNPTEQEVREAREFLLHLIEEFPWQSPEDPANFLALWMTPLLLPMLTDPPPIGVISAPMMGSGKTLLSKILDETHGAVIRGQLPGDGEEQRKQITTILTQTTAPVVVWDNVAGTVRSEHLASLVTKGTWTDRILGATQEVTVPARRLFVLNGNNVTLGGDLGRRAIWATIDADTARPWERTGFRITNLERHVREHRGQVLAAMLTLIRAWVVAGAPKQPGRSDSFAEWFGIMRGLFGVVGLGEVGATQADHNVDGEEDQEFAEFLLALHEHFGDTEFKVGEAARACVEKASSGGGFSDLGHALPAALHDRLVELTYRPEPFTKALGRYFGNRSGRWAGEGYVLRHRPDPRNRSKKVWRVASKGADGPASTAHHASDQRSATAATAATESGVSEDGEEEFGPGRKEGSSDPSVRPKPVAPVDSSGTRRSEASSEGSGPPSGGTLAFDFETSDAGRLFEEPREGFCRLLAVSDGEQNWVTDDPVKMRAWLQDADLLIGHNAYDFDVIAAGWHLSMDIAKLLDKTVDTFVWSRLVEPPAATTDRRRLSYTLDAVAQRRVGMRKTGDVSRMAARWNREAKLSNKYDAIPTTDPDYRAYAAQDALMTYHVWQDQLGAIPDQDYAERELRIAREASLIRSRGIPVDLDLVLARLQQAEDRLEETRATLRDRWGIPVRKKLGKDGLARFREALEGLGVDDIPLTATGQPSVSRDDLDALAGLDNEVGELCRTVLALNADRGLADQIRRSLGSDGRLHPSIDVSNQASGRWSVTHPGLTTFGKRSDRLLAERDMIRADDGKVLYARDLSNIDVRGMAALSQDEAMIQRLQPGLTLDWHEQVAELIFGDPTQRSKAKALSHAINYGTGPSTIAEHAVISLDQAHTILAILRERFPRLTEFKEQVIAAAEAGEVIENGWGRRLTVTVDRSYTQAPGLSGQGWARDVAMECLIRMADRGVAQYVVAFVHDEFVFEVPQDRVDHVLPLIEEAMTFARDGVPVLSDGTRLARCWGDLYREEET